MVLSCLHLLKPFLFRVWKYTVKTIVKWLICTWRLNQKPKEIYFTMDFWTNPLYVWTTPIRKWCFSSGRMEYCLIMTISCTSTGRGHNLFHVLWFSVLIHTAVWLHTCRVIARPSEYGTGSVARNRQTWDKRLREAVAPGGLLHQWWWWWTNSVKQSYSWKVDSYLGGQIFSHICQLSVLVWLTEHLMISLSIQFSHGWYRTTPLQNCIWMIRSHTGTLGNRLEAWMKFVWRGWRSVWNEACLLWIYNWSQFA